MPSISTNDIVDFNLNSGTIIVNDKPRMADIQLSRQKRNYISAQTNYQNQNTWTNATGGDPDTFIAPALQTIRNRCRFIQRNSPLAAGIISTFSTHVVGSGPRLQYIPEIEVKFNQWAEICDIETKLSLADNLKNDIESQLIEGESLTFLTTDKKSDYPVSLRIQNIAVDRLDTPYQFYNNDRIRQGVEVDNNGKPIKYYISKSHPYSYYGSFGSLDYETVSANQIIHLFQCKSAGQSRGIPLIQSAIPLYAQLYRFINATLSAAEIAADFSAIIKSNSDLVEEDSLLTAMDTFEVERGMAMTLPNGWEMQQFKAEHPNSTFGEFRKEIINEIARAINMPLGVAMANFSGYNYSSGRLDMQMYYRFIKTIQQWIAIRKLNRLLKLFIREASLISGFLSNETLRELTNNTYVPIWLWPGFEHVDPQKEAAALKTHLEIGETTLTEEWIRQGKDPDQQFKKLVDEVNNFRLVGLLHPFDREASKTNTIDKNMDNEDEQT